MTTTTEEQQARTFVEAHLTDPKVRAIDWQAIGARHPRTFTKSGSYIVGGQKLWLALDAHQAAALDGQGLRIIDDRNAPPSRPALTTRLALAGFGGAR